MIDQSSGEGDYEDGDIEDYPEPDYIQEMELADIDPSTVKKVPPQSTV